MKYIYLGFLLINALWDVKTKKLPAVWLYVGLIWLGIYGVYQLVADKREWWELLAALLPGISCYLLARLSKAMGEGDALLILGSGLCFSVKSVLSITMAAFFLSAIGAVVVMIVKRNMKNKRIPFVPYLFCGTVIVCTLGGL